jgi:hypothetical protein
LAILVAAGVFLGEGLFWLFSRRNRAAQQGFRVLNVAASLSPRSDEKAQLVLKYDVQVLHRGTQALLLPELPSGVVITSAAAQYDGYDTDVVAARDGRLWVPLKSYRPKQRRQQRLVAILDLGGAKFLKERVWLFRIHAHTRRAEISLGMGEGSPNLLVRAILYRGSMPSQPAILLPVVENYYSVVFSDLAPGAAIGLSWRQLDEPPE